MAFKSQLHMVFVYKEKIELFNCANKLKGLNSMNFFKCWRSNSIKLHLLTYLFCKKLVPDCSWLETNELRNWWFGLLSYSRSVLNFSLFPRSDQRRILNLNNEAFDTVPVDGSWEWPTYILHNRTELCHAIVIIVIDCSKK